MEGTRRVGVELEKLYEEPWFVRKHDRAFGDQDEFEWTVKLF